MGRNPVPLERRPFVDVALGCFRVPLSQGKTALIDADDAARVGQYVWTYSTSDGREDAYRNNTRQRGPGDLGRFITGAGCGDFVGHSNDDTLDFRKANLRVRSRQMASAGMRKYRRECSSTFKGVCRRFKHGKHMGWQAYITVAGRRITLGDHGDEHRAAEAYDDAARLYFGEFARPNFPNEGRAL